MSIQLADVAGMQRLQMLLEVRCLICVLPATRTGASSLDETLSNRRSKGTCAKHTTALQHQATASALGHEKVALKKYQASVSIFGQHRTCSVEFESNTEVFSQDAVAEAAWFQKMCVEACSGFH